MTHHCINLRKRSGQRYVGGPIKQDDIFSGEGHTARQVGSGGGDLIYPGVSAGIAQSPEEYVSNAPS